MHKITGNEVSAISSHNHSHIRILLRYPVDKSCMQFFPYSMHVFDHGTHMCEFLYVYRSLSIRKFTIRKEHEILSIGLNVLEFFCVPLHTEFLPDLYETL